MKQPDSLLGQSQVRDLDEAPNTAALLLGETRSLPTPTMKAIMLVSLSNL